MKNPGIMIAADRSGSGKTTITIGILAVLKNRGLKVRPYKVGPDYLDAMYHKVVAGVDSYNLDSWMLKKDYLKKHFYETSKGFGISVIEGVMGLFDGKGDGIEGSSAEIAIILDIPVILVIDCHALSGSVAPIVFGFMNYDMRVKIEGIIFNNVASERHLAFLKNSIKKLNMPVIGHLYRDDGLSFKSRHLGLFSFFERDFDSVAKNEIIRIFEKNINIDLLIEIASRRDSVILPDENTTNNISSNKISNEVGCRLAVAYDEAFHFYYSANIDLLKSYGARIVKFSPLHDKKLPDGVDGVYLGGGYPEVYAEKLSNNIEMNESIKKFADAGGIIYAECGGLIYLGKSVEYMGKVYQMVGIFGIDFKMYDKLKRLGYAEVELLEDSIIGRKKAIARGHEFHYSGIINKEIYKRDDIKKIYHVRSSNLNHEEKEGFCYKNVLASYIHLHFGSNSQIARNLVDSCKKI